MQTHTQCYQVKLGAETHVSNVREFPAFAARTRQPLITFWQVVEFFFFSIPVDDFSNGRSCADDIDQLANGRGALSISASALHFCFVLMHSTVLNMVNTFVADVLRFVGNDAAISWD